MFPKFHLTKNLCVADLFRQGLQGPLPASLRTYSYACCADRLLLTAVQPLRNDGDILCFNALNIVRIRLSSPNDYKSQNRCSRSRASRYHPRDRKAADISQRL